MNWKLVKVKISKTSQQFDGQKGIFAWTFWYDWIFGFQNPHHISNPEFGDVHFIIKFYGDLSTWRGSAKNRVKNSKTSFLETAISRVKWRYSGGFSSMFRNKIEIDEIISLLRGASSKNHAFSNIEVFFFRHIVVFCQCGFEKLGSKIGHSRRMGNFTRERTLNDEYLSQFL